MTLPSCQTSCPSAVKRAKSGCPPYSEVRILPTKTPARALTFSSLPFQETLNKLLLKKPLRLHNHPLATYHYTGGLAGWAWGLEGSPASVGLSSVLSHSPGWSGGGEVGGR